MLLLFISPVSHLKVAKFMISNRYLPTCMVSGWLGHNMFSHYSFLVPTPTVTITSGTIAVGSALTLTCSVEFRPAVDVPVAVTTVWTGPAGFMNTTTAVPVMGSTTTYTSTAMVSSFGRDQSGDYTCVATVNSTSYFIDRSMAYASTRVTVGKVIIGTYLDLYYPMNIDWNHDIGIHTGVYLSLNGVIYSNNSKITITDIGETNTLFSPPPNSNNGLQCITDRVPCCNALGEWFLPDGETVPSQINATTFYRNRGDDGTVNLNRLTSDVMMPTGWFCCVVLDAISTEVTTCVNIG